MYDAMIAYSRYETSNSISHQEEALHPLQSHAIPPYIELRFFYVLYIIWRCLWERKMK